MRHREPAPARRPRESRRGDVRFDSAGAASAGVASANSSAARSLMTPAPVAPNPANAPATPARTGTLIRRARQARGLSQQELGALVGLSQPEVSRLESRGLARDPAVLARIAAALEVPGDLLGALLAEGELAQWQRWVWASRRKPYEKLLLLALLECPDARGDLDALMARTGLGPGTARSLLEGLVRDGVVRAQLDPRRRCTVVTFVRHAGDACR